MTEEKITPQYLKELIIASKLDEIKEIAFDEHPADFAQQIKDFDLEETTKVLDLLPLERQAKMIAYFEEDFVVDLGFSLGAKKFANILNVMSSDDRADILNLFEPPFYDEILNAMAKVEREDIKRLSAYDEDSVGSIMTTDYATLSEEMSVEDALKKLKREAREKETINRTYVIDRDRKLLGTVKLQNLFLADRNAKVRDVMQEYTMAIPLNQTPEYAAQQISKYDVIALPVIDKEERLCGIVTYDDALDILQEEATEDFHHHASVGKITGDLATKTVWLFYQKRIGWLVLLVFGNIFSGAGIAYFEKTIEAYVALVFFLPLLIDSGGNAGSQSATLMVRALATGEVVAKDWSKMMGREVFVALMLGLTMALAVSILGVFRAGPEIAMVVSLTMILVVTVGSVIGMGLPFILSRLNLDPATASAPLITSIADAVGVLIYFAMATAILPEIV